MNISPSTIQTLHQLTSQDASLLDDLYAVRSLDQAVDVVIDSAHRLKVAIDRREVASYFQRTLATAD